MSQLPVDLESTPHVTKSTQFLLPPSRGRRPTPEHALARGEVLGVALEPRRSIGADGRKTLVHLQTGFRSGDSSAVTTRFSSLTSQLNSATDGGVIVSTANRIYVDGKISLLPEYQGHVEKEYPAKVESIDFSAKSDAASTIALAILINAVYFLGNWERPFNQHHTAPDVFRGVKGEREENYMTYHFKPIAANFAEGSTTFKLAYKDPAYSFFVVLPSEDSTLEAFLSQVDGPQLKGLLDGVNTTTCDLYLPRFKVESKVNGNELLNKLGVNTLISDGADLSKISEVPLKISKVQHNAVIEVNERGTEAAAATGIEAVPMCLPPQIRVDRPFLYGITYGDDSEVLFLGQFV